MLDKIALPGSNTAEMCKVFLSLVSDALGYPDSQTQGRGRGAWFEHSRLSARCRDAARPEGRWLWPSFQRPPPPPLDALVAPEGSAATRSNEAQL